MKNGLVADFNEGPSCLNAFRLKFFTFSDSIWGMNSTFTYARIQENATNGCLQIVYQLQPKDPSQAPYIGLLTDFADPFPVPYNLSRFTALKLRIKTAQPYAGSPIHVYLVLYSGNIRTSRTEEFPRYEIPTQFLTTDWVDVKAPFAEFKEAIGSSGERRPLDITQVYRVGLLIIGPADSVAHGRLYIDEVYFVN